jgi:hypothetical protein
MIRKYIPEYVTLRTQTKVIWNTLPIQPVSALHDITADKRDKMTKEMCDKVFLRKLQ